jgi:hypothetical protein
VTGDDYVTMAEFAELLGVTYKQMTMYRSRGKLPMAALNSSNHPLWIRDAVETFVAEVRVDPTILDKRTKGNNRGKPRLR